MLTLAFLLSVMALIFQSVLFPKISILAFAPFLALSILRTKISQALWLACFSGMVMDLISNDPIGVHALNYVLSTTLLFKLKKHLLFEDPFHISVLSTIFSSVITFFGLFLLFLFDRRVPIEGKWILLDLFGMPVVDGLFAFVWFTAPLTLFSKCKKMWALFWLKRKTTFRTSR